MHELGGRILNHASQDITFPPVIIATQTYVSLPVSRPFPLGHQDLPRQVFRSERLIVQFTLGASLGAISNTLIHSQYQVLINRGWRRYGVFFLTSKHVQSAMLFSDMCFCMIVRAITTINRTPSILAAYITLFGRYRFTDPTHICSSEYSLDSTAFDSRRDQRQAINRFNKYILGQAYRHNAARFCPESRE